MKAQYHIGPISDCMKTRGYMRDKAAYRAITHQVGHEGNLWGVPMDA